MKGILNFPTLMLLFVAALFMTSCGDDEPGGVGGTTDTAPSVTLISLSDLTLSPTEEFTIEISAAQGTNEMNGVYVYEDGIEVPEGRLKYDGVAASANPALLVGTDRESLSWTISVIAQATAESSSNFEVEVRDNAATPLRSSVFVTVATAATPPTLTGLGDQMPTLTEGTQNVKFIVTGEKGSGLLSSLEVRRNSELVDAADFNWNDLTMMTAGNPFQLTGADVDGFVEGEFLVDLPLEVGTSIYSFILEDEFGSRDTASYTVVTETSGTALDSTLVGILFNAGGDVGFGGLDLDNGESTGTGPTSGANAEIIDNGIDTDLGSATNWIQTISPINGATMKYVVASAGGVLESFSFESTNTKEGIVDVFDNNTTTEITNATSTSIIEVGDVFAVKSGNKYYLIAIREVNVKNMDNTDNYVVDVKY
jgi:hypothetical protein